MSAEQVLAWPDNNLSEIAEPDQEPKRAADMLSSFGNALVVQDGVHTPNHASTRVNQPKKRQSAKKKKRGGWPPTSRLEWNDVKQIDDAINQLAKRGFPPTHLVTIMPPSGDAETRKRYCTRASAHLGEALTRHGRPHIGITVFEHPVDKDLHAHHLVYVPPDEYDTVQRRHRLPEVHVGQITSLGEMVGYVTKERRRLSPDFEARIRRPWRRCRPVPGKKWAMTAAAKEVIRFV